MVIARFPPVELADRHGLLAVGGDLEVPSLLLAYRSGIFPWPVEEDSLAWFAPRMRAILHLDTFHPPRSLLKAMRREIERLELAVDRDFRSVIQACAELKNRGKQHGTWITSQIVQGYSAFHRACYAHSIECYLDGELKGGLYGVSIGRMFAGESMFYRHPNASKYCLCHLIELLKARDVKWIDCQVMTPFFAALGAVEVPRERFMEMLRDALDRPGSVFPGPAETVRS